MHKEGLSLIEILISVILLALVLTGILNVFIAGRRYVTLGRTKSVGMELGKIFLDPLQNQFVRQYLWADPNNCLTSNPTTGCPTLWTINNTPYTPNWTINDVGGGTGLRRVIVTITWPKE